MYMYVSQRASYTWMQTLFRTLEAGIESLSLLARGVGEI
jgi:hypothetical protein